MMTALAQLSQQYRRQYDWSDANTIRKGLAQAAETYVRRNALALGDGIAVAVALEALLAHEEVHLDQLSEPAREAFHAAFPHVSIDSLQDASPQQLEGMLNAWKGKLFEIDVRDRLNQGEVVGDWQLEPGQQAYLAESANQPGWDLSIKNDDGSVADVIQLKATASADYVQQALERYPDIQILTTSDVATGVGHLDDVSSDAVSVHDLSGQITDAVPMDGAGQAGDGIGMMAPASLIAFTEAWHVLSGKKSVDQALASGGGRLILAGLAAAAGAAVTVVTGGLFGSLVAIGARLFLGNKVNQMLKGERTQPQKLLGTGGYTFDGEARVVAESPPLPRTVTPRRKPKKGCFRNLENVSAYLTRRYAPGYRTRNRRKPPLARTQGPDTEATSAKVAHPKTAPVTTPPEASSPSQPSSFDRHAGKPFPQVGMRVEHCKHGQGTIESVDERYVFILFDGDQERTQYQLQTCLDPAWIKLLP